jgi:sulfotransferase family protein
MRICVVGMHRSGTSIAARVLNRLGVDLGPEQTLLDADAQDNPRGYWEQRAIVELNDALLERLGGPWTDPPRLRPGWHRSSDLDELRARARRLLDETFGPGPSGWKDPRGSLTLPFWLSLEPSLRVVVCVRHPLEVAGSWARRGPGFDARFALELWMEHTARALIDSGHRSRLILHHEDLFGDLDRQVDRLARFAGVEPVSTEARAAIGRFVDEGLWRSRARSGLRLPSEVERLYELLRDATPDGTDQLAAPVRELLESRHRAQDRDLLGYQWPRLRERARRKVLKPSLWRVRELLFAARGAARSQGVTAVERRVGIMIGALDRRRQDWRVE